MRTLKSLIVALSLALTTSMALAEFDGDCGGIELHTLENDVQERVLAEGADSYHDVLAAFNYDIDVALMLASNN